MRNAKEQKNNKMNKCEMRMMTASQPIRTSYHNKKTKMKMKIKIKREKSERKKQKKKIVWQFLGDAIKVINLIVIGDFFYYLIYIVLYA